MLNAKLVVVGGDAKKAEVRLKLPTIIGRGKEAGLTVPHALVSRQHTEIFEREGRLFVRDMGSLNGTYVNNTRIENEQPLEPNQLLTLGNITFRAVYEIQTNADAGTDESEVVTFNEVDADANQDVQDSIQVKTPSGKNQLSSISDVMSFDETVPVESIDSNNKQVDTSRPESNQKNPEQKKSTAPADERPTEPDLFQGNDATESAAADTDKSFVHRDSTPDGSTIGSSVFSIESDEVDPANKSVSASALNNLPTAQAAASFVNFDSGEEGDSKPVSQIDADQLDLGEDEKKSNVDVDSTLGSFLKKLPR